VLATFLLLSLHAQESKPIKVLFLGDNGHHRPAERFRQLQPVLAKRGIDLTYTDKMEALDPKLLSSYDALILYANTTQINPGQEKALLSFVEGGKGFIPIHCASYCFLNSPKYVDLVGAQFLKHGTGTVRTSIAVPDHPVMQGFGGFESWDETYVHTRHNPKDRTVLEYRDENGQKEPWTWVRMQGNGRVFYTAWGHDHRTWGNPGFQNLIERGIRWAAGHKPGLAGEFRADPPFPIPEMTPKRTDVKPFEYVDVGKKIPNYTPSRQWGVQGEPFSKMQVPLPAEESLKHFVVPKGFRVELFASEANFGGGKPICMNWDERGRLWVALTYDYPNELRPAGQGRDRLVICEDTNGDSKADKTTVFAEQLSIPTSLTFAQGGVVVFDGNQTLFLKDTSGDDVADVRQVLFGRWSQNDTHGGPSNMQYGLDNWIWAMQGYNDSRLTVGGETHRFRQGFFRFKLAPGLKENEAKLEFIRSTDNNTWGLGISEEGIIFGSTANRNPSVYMPIPNRYYEEVRGWTPALMLRIIADTHLFKPITDRVRQVDQHGGYTAAAGHALYTARNYPKEYWNRVAFVAEPTGHLVGTFILRAEGSNFRSNNPFNLLASDDEWSAPIMAEVGPDGNVWVIDWYNFIVQHNPTPQGFQTGRGAAYESDLRDKKHGRVYRIVYEGNRNQESGNPKGFSLAEATPEKLVQTLKHENLFWRRHAQRLLVERGKQDVVPALCELIRDGRVDEIGLNVGAIHALWTLHGLGALEGPFPDVFRPDDPSALVKEVLFGYSLRHVSAGVRRNAVQVLPKTPLGTAAIFDQRLLHDDDAQVRLMAFLALADRPPTVEAGEQIVAALSEPRNLNDRWIPDAATCAAAKNDRHFLRAVAERESPASGLLPVATIVAEHYARGTPLDSIRGIIGRLTNADPRAADAIVAGLARGWPKSAAPQVNEQLEADLEALASRLPPERRGQLIKLAIAWGSPRFEKQAAEVFKALVTQVQDDSLKPEARLAAAQELATQRGSDRDTVKTLLNIITPRTSPELAAGILQALRLSDAAEVGPLVLERLPGLTPAARSLGLGLLLSRPEWTRTLLDGAEKGTVQLADLALDQKQALAEHPDRFIRRRAQELLRRGGALPSADRQKVLDELLPIVREKGDPTAGKLVFKNQCAKCHVHGGEGERIGPDLTGMATHPKEEMLLNIIDPSRNVEGNFRVYAVATTSGRVLTGMLAAESRTAIELFDAEGKKQTLLREDIEELRASPKSLMPDGFEKQVSRKDLTDLLEFLAQRGKYLPLPLDKVATAMSTRGMFYNADAPVERLIFDDWKPKTFAEIPFHLVDPQNDRVSNVILLYGPQGSQPPKMPKSVVLPCNAPAKAIHLLSGVSGWGFPYSERGSVSLIVRLHYDDGKTEDHPLKNGEHFADYIRRVDVPESKFAFNLRGRQIRYLAIHPGRADKIKQIEFVKGPDDTAPVIMAVTLEGGE
jgi:hypothetical protein